jgi:hypothetical protein
VICLACDECSVKHEYQGTTGERKIAVCKILLRGRISGFKNVLMKIVL